MSIFKACDIRGVVGADWGETEAGAIGKGLARMAQSQGRSQICVAGDFRRSTAVLKQSLIDGITSAGTSVVDFGQCPTPVAYFATTHRNLDSVAIVTASHNPGRYNGIKFMIGGHPAVPDIVAELQRFMLEPTTAKKQGRIDHFDATPVYESWISEQCVANARPVQNSAALSIVLDTMNGAFAHVAPRVLRAAGCSVTALGDTIDPDFAERAPNPAVDANLKMLVGAVRKQNADAGIALDGDGDRVVFVDRQGEIVRPEQIAAILIRSGPANPRVIYDLKCASLVARVTREAGGTAVMRPSGHGFIKTSMIRDEADWGVEVSGHHFFRALHGGDDGLFTALKILALMRHTGKSLDELVAPFPWPLITPDLRIPFTGDSAAVIESIAACCGGQTSRLDGVRAEYPHGWGLARTSITEPAITFRFEGPDAEGLISIAVNMLAGAGDLKDTVLEAIHEWFARSTDRNVSPTR